METPYKAQRVLLERDTNSQSKAQDSKFYQDLFQSSLRNQAKLQEYLDEKSETIKVKDEELFGLELKNKILNDALQLQKEENERLVEKNELQKYINKKLINRN